MLDATGCRLEDSSFYHVTIKVLRVLIEKGVLVVSLFALE